MCYSTPHMAQARGKRGPEAAIETEPKVREQLNFYGEGIADVIARDLKLGTCRVSHDRYTFTPGQVVEAYCRDDDSEARIPVVILNVLKKVHLGAIRLSVLSLDGFFDFGQALDDLKQFYPDLNMLTELDYITFMTLDRFQCLSPKAQEKLLTESTEKLLEDRRLRDLFFPSIAFWMGVRGGNAMTYHEFLVTEEMATQDEVDNALSAISRGARLPQAQRRIEARLNNLENLAQLADSADPLYAWAILLRKPR